MYMWGAGAGGRAAQAAGPVRARRTIHIYANLTPWGDRRAGPPRMDSRITVYV